MRQTGFRWTVTCRTNSVSTNVAVLKALCVLADVALVNTSCCDCVRLSAGTPPPAKDGPRCRAGRAEVLADVARAAVAAAVGVVALLVAAPPLPLPVADDGRRGPEAVVMEVLAWRVIFDENCLRNTPALPGDDGPPGELFGGGALAGSVGNATPVSSAKLCTIRLRS